MTEGNTHKFSALDRKQMLAGMATEYYDLVIIGGGITGAGIALDAVTRGLKVALVEKNDYGWGTSSRSTKLVHGGLRYLKQLEFALVHEVGVERAIVHNNARHVVIPEKMLLPIIKDGSLGKNMSSLGLWVYDRLAKVEKDERRRMLEREDVIKAEPLLRQDILEGGGLYFEYRTDDARLTIENIKKASEKGANCLNYMECVDIVYNAKQKVCGIKAKDSFTGEEIEIKGKRIVNACGPWVDTIRKIDKDGVKGKYLYLTKGVHIVVPRERLDIQQSVYFDVEADKRMCFAIPRGNITYIGTTDTVYNKDINRPVATKEDVEYILKATNYMFPDVNLTIEDVNSTWAGLRPLIHQEGKSPSELSRKDEIFYSKTGLISIAGGKLTGYRKMAERVVDLVCKTMKVKKSSITRDLKLSGGDFESTEAFEKYINLKVGEAKQVCENPTRIVDLAYRYGSNLDEIIGRAYEVYNQYTDEYERMHAAELWYAVEHEMVHNLCDYLIRRSGRLYFEYTSLERLYPFVAEEMSKIFSWSAEEKQAQLEAFELEYKEVVSFKK